MACKEHEKPHESTSLVVLLADHRHGQHLHLVGRCAHRRLVLQQRRKSRVCPWPASNPGDAPGTRKSRGRESATPLRGDSRLAITIAPDLKSGFWERSPCLIWKSAAASTPTGLFIRMTI